MGSRERPIVGKTTGEEREVISAFVGDEPGQRENRLRE